MQLVTSSGDGTLNVTPPENPIVSPDTTVKATQPDNNPQLATFFNGGPLKTALFIGMIWLAYKYLRRK